MRINKYLAQSGIGSRRKVEELVLAGKVKVNGEVVKNLATDIKETDQVTFENKPIRATKKYVYYKLHKPKGFVTTLKDEKDRKTVMSLLRGVHVRVFPVGRLDYDTEGLLLFTNDGDLTNILTKPNSEIAKTYVATLEGEISQDEIKQLSSGVDIGDYVTKPCSVKLLDKNSKTSRVQVSITEGKNRQVRRMFEAIGKNITFLKRTEVGEIRLGGLSRGEYAELNSKEQKYLMNLKK